MFLVKCSFYGWPKLGKGSHIAAKTQHVLLRNVTLVWPALHKLPWFGLCVPRCFQRVLRERRVTRGAEGERSRRGRHMSSSPRRRAAQRPLQLRVFFVARSRTLGFDSRRVFMTAESLKHTGVPRRFRLEGSSCGKVLVLRKSPERVRRRLQELHDVRVPQLFEQPDLAEGAPREALLLGMDADLGAGADGTKARQLATSLEASRMPNFPGTQRITLPAGSLPKQLRPRTAPTLCPPTPVLCLPGSSPCPKSTNPRAFFSATIWPDLSERPARQAAAGKRWLPEGLGDYGFGGFEC